MGCPVLHIESFVELNKSGFRKTLTLQKSGLNACSVLLFGFNGMEKDNEVKGKGNSYDFGARIYDSRLGRWLSLDPLQAKYPSMSPYIFSGNSPITFYDAGGKEIIIYYWDEATKTEKPYVYTPGMKLSVKNDFLSAVDNAIKEAMNVPKGQQVWGDLAKSDGVVNIKQSSGKSNFEGAAYVDPKDADKTKKRQIGNINIDLSVINEVEDNDGKTMGYMLPSTALIHEAGHAQEYDIALKKSWEATEQYIANDAKGSNPQFGTIEEARNIQNTEHVYVIQLNAWMKNTQKVEKQIFQPLRPNHNLGDLPFKTIDAKNGSFNGHFNTMFNQYKIAKEAETGVKINDGSDGNDVTNKNTDGKK